ncbi:ATP-binding cassette domain-containing protein [Schaalia sp. Marseille-Q2122]|uniref:ATP-binding cassette domain-containing protein n=1 Tax=Schaalia sp. Marseille-Q2122 TaxID=2736604 RepID=UPI00158BA9AB|nr:ABC transporter ATP-binding protein [Schaalia sp. Marseille-Q2122]
MTTPLTASATGLSYRYGKNTLALDNLTLSFPAGQVSGLFGSNGAGKTTLLSLMGGLLFPTAGSIHIGEETRTDYFSGSVALVGTGADLILKDFSLEESIKTHSEFRPTFERALFDEFLSPLNIDLGKKVDALSRGQRSAVSAAIGLASRAPVTIFDEVTLGMDARTRQRFYDILLTDHEAHPRTIVLSTHLIAEVERLISSAVIIEGGRLVAQGSPEEIASSVFAISGEASQVQAFADTHLEYTLLDRRDAGSFTRFLLRGQAPQSLHREADAAGGLSVEARVSFDECVTALGVDTTEMEA